MMTQHGELLRATGRALYGERFQSELAEALAINRRTIRRWLNGEDEPRSGIWVDLARLVAERSAELRDVAAALKAKVDT